MNKRARLTRRILREHRTRHRFSLFHYEKTHKGWYQIWWCTHCVHPKTPGEMLPRAYR